MVLERVVEDGKWWAEEWWLGEQYRRLEVPHDRVVALIEVLKAHFPAEWARERAVEFMQFVNRERKDHAENVVFRALCFGQGLMPLEGMLSIATVVEACAGCPGSDRVMERLRGAESHSALMELTVARAFASRAVHVAFPKGHKVNKGTTARGHDVQAEKDGNLLAIECKYQHREQWEDRERAVMLEVTHRLPRSGQGVEVRLVPNLADLFPDPRAEPKLHAEMASIFGKIIGDGMAAELARSRAPRVFNIDGLAECEVAPEDEVASFGVGGSYVSGPGRLRGLLRKFLDAVSQLPLDAPGLVCLQTESLGVTMPKALAHTVFTAVMGSDTKFQHVAGVVIFAGRTIFQHATNWAVENPAARVRLRASPLAGLLLEHFAVEVLE